ncbi:hypothetical protein Tco_0596333 [Tanacetum coccineum]
MNDEAKDHPKLLRGERNLFLAPREKRWTRKSNYNRGGSRRASYPPHARKWRISLRGAIQAFFQQTPPRNKNQMVLATTPLLGFSGEISWPLGQISLMVSLGDGEHSTSITMNFMVVRSPSPYNVTIRSNTVIPAECRMITGAPSGPPPQEPTATKGIKVAIHLEYPEQTIMIGRSLSEKGRMELCNLLKDSLDIFAWKPANMTGVPRSIAEHRLNIREGCQPIRQKRRGQAPDMNKAIQEEVTKLMEAEIMREVHYHD